MKLNFLGAAREVTGSCFLVEGLNLRFLVDCGMVQGGRAAAARERLERAALAARQITGAPDLAAADRFYRDVLGFNQSDRITDGGRELLFYHCNGRHHSLAIGSPAPGMRGAHHLMLEVNSLDDVGIAVDRCAELNVPVSKSIGCHTNDRMVSTYIVSPSVLRIEYGFGGLAIDDLWEPKSYTRTSIWGHKELRPDLPPAMIVGN